MLRRAKGMERHMVRRTVVATGVPIPEMIAGAIMGGLASLILTYVDSISPLLRLGSPTLYLIVGGAAAIGAALSFFLAREHVVEVQERVETRDVERRAA
jgi:hypothetical protein